MIIVLLGGTCSGKTEMALHFEKYGFKKVITNTTRSRRIDDTENSYHFLTREEFMKKVENGEMIEYAEYNGNLYGSSIDSFTENCVIVLEPKGYRALKVKKPNEVYGVYLDVPEEIRINRGIARGDKREVIEKRIIEDRDLFDESLKSEVNVILKHIGLSEIEPFITEKLDIIKTF